LSKFLKNIYTTQYTLGVDIEGIQVLERTKPLLTKLFNIYD